MSSLLFCCWPLLHVGPTCFAGARTSGDLAELERDRDLDSTHVEQEAAVGGLIEVPTGALIAVGRIGGRFICAGTSLVGILSYSSVFFVVNFNQDSKIKYF